MRILWDWKFMLATGSHMKLSNQLQPFPEVMELNIGHFLIGEAIFRGLQPAMAEMRRLMDEARARNFA